MLIKSPFISVLLIFFFLSINVVLTPDVLALESLAYGEIKASGEVLIESSKGKWLKVRDVYPLLNETKLKTGDGVVMIVMKDGSRINLSEETETALKAQNSKYTYNLAKGTLSFRIIPYTSLTIITPHVTISATPNPSNIEGIVSSSDKGTEVRSLSGNINVSYSSHKRLLKTNERLFAASTAGTEKNSKAAATKTEKTIAGMKPINFIILGAFLVGAGTIIAVNAFRGDDDNDNGVASPSSP